MPNRAPTALASMTRGLLRWAERRGIPRDAIVTSAELELIERAGDAGRIPRALHAGVWRAVERAVSDPAFGLKAAASILETSSFGLVGVLAMTSGTVGESLARSAKYSRLLKEDVLVRTRTTAEGLVVEIASSEPQDRPVADASLYAFLHFVEQWSGETVRPRAAFFRHPRPPDASEYERFRCPVHFGHPVDALVLDTEVRGLPLRTAQPEVARYLEAIGDATLAELALGAGPLDLRARVGACVREAIEAGRGDVREVARRMGTSSRTLQRALAAEGLTFRRVLDEERYALAAPLVAATDEPLEAIAERLGFADGKAFRRAFRRWAGVPPVQLRRRAGGT